MQKRSSNRTRNILILLTLIGLACCCAVGAPGVGLLINQNSPAAATANHSDEPDSTIPVEPTSTPEPTPTPYIIASYREIRDAKSILTDLQWNRYKEEIVGAQVQNWEGWVREVDEDFLGGITMRVDLWGNQTDTEAWFSVSEEVGLSVRRNEQIYFSGTIASVSELFGISIELENATIETFRQND